MKKITLIVVLSIICSSCSTLFKGQSQPVKLIDNQNQIYLVTCSGPAETMGICYGKVRETCNRQYKIINETTDSRGIHREVKFQCIN